jgi:large subunit ribosomal protein L10
MRDKIARKKSFAESLQKELSGANAIILTDFRGLSTKNMQRVRSLCKEKGFQYKVVKNSLVKRAIEGKPFFSLNNHLFGPTAMAWGSTEPVDLLRALFDFAKEEKKLKIKAAYIEGRVFEEEEAKAVSRLPSKEQMLSTLIATIASPIIGLQWQIKSPICALLYALGNLRDTKEVRG